MTVIKPTMKLILGVGLLLITTAPLHQLPLPLPSQALPPAKPLPLPPKTPLT